MFTKIFKTLEQPGIQKDFIKIKLIKGSTPASETEFLFAPDKGFRGYHRKSEILLGHKYSFLDVILKRK